MQIVITAVGPDNVRLADPIIHYVTGQGRTSPKSRCTTMTKRPSSPCCCGFNCPAAQLAEIRQALAEIGGYKKLSDPRLVAGRAGSPAAAGDLRHLSPRTAAGAAAGDSRRPDQGRAGRDDRQPPRLPRHRRAVRRAVGDRRRREGRADDDRWSHCSTSTRSITSILARYMRILPAASCWKYAGGRIINLHHGLLPSFPGLRPYHDAYAGRMLTYGATCHFIVPELDAGNQIIHQSTFTVPPGMKLDEIIRIGQEDNEPRCLVEGVRRVVNREVQLHFHRVVAR